VKSPSAACGAGYLAGSLLPAGFSVLKTRAALRAAAG
jgi:hypothetical protein